MGYTSVQVNSQSETFFHLPHREILNSPNLQNEDWGLVRHSVCGHLHLLLYLRCQLCEGVGHPSWEDQQLTLHLLHLILHLLYLQLHLLCYGGDHPSQGDQQDLPELHTELRSSSYNDFHLDDSARNRISHHNTLAISLCSAIKLPSSFCLNRNIEIK